MLEPLVTWYHVALSHVGMTRLEQTIKLHFYHSKLKATIAKVVGSCGPCQWLKVRSQQYGELPPRDVLVAPWHKVNVDLIGPRRHALTVINPVTNLLEIYRLREKTAVHVAQQFENGWLA
jgi:Integrase zinc binding domain